MAVNRRSFIAGILSLPIFQRFVKAESPPPADAIHIDTQSPHLMPPGTWIVYYPDGETWYFDPQFKIEYKIQPGPCADGAWEVTAARKGPQICSRTDS